MGVIQRQGIKNAIISYIGIVIGAVSVLFIYQIDDEIYGYAQFLIGTAGFLYAFANFGVNSLVVKFYPFFKVNKHDDQGFIILILLLYHLALLVFLSLFFSFDKEIYDGLAGLGVDENRLIADNIQFILPILYFMGLGSIFFGQSTNFHRIVVPDIIGPLSLKIFLPLAILAYVWSLISKEQFATGFIFYYAAVAIALLVYIVHLKALTLKFPSWRQTVKKKAKSMASFALFGSANQIGSMLAFRIDAIMVSTMINLASNQVYFIMYFLSNVIAIPTQSINKIASPIISEAWSKNNMQEIQNIYKKSSINLVVLGIPMLFVIWFSLNTLDILSSENSKFFTGRYVFLLLGIAKIFDMLTSVNGHIINYSPKYRYMLLFVIILGISNVFLNYYLIGAFGIEGAAMASCLAIFLFNFFKLGFIWKEFRMHPFSDQLGRLSIIVLLTAVVIYFAPNFNHVIAEFIKNVAMLGVIYLPLIYYFTIAPDLNKILKVRLRDWIK